jgi:23S rRNA (adenine2503-C2)-methyltransferase
MRLEAVVILSFRLQISVKCSMLTQAVNKKMRQPVSLDANRPTSEVPALEKGGIPFERRLFGLNTESLTALMVHTGEPGWRGRQLSEAIYRHRFTEISEITTLPKSLRRRLVSEGWEVGRPEIVQAFQSSDGTERYLIQRDAGLSAEAKAPSNEAVETVWMPEGDGGETDDENSPEPADEAARRWQRATLCVSSQIGCQVNCQFCLTARLGFQRDLTVGEIAGQVLAAFNRHGVEVGRDRVNLVFMGMGEPFLNYGNFMAAVRLLVREVGLSPQRMTVSTAGIVPGIERFALEPAELRPRLAISLNAPDDMLRNELMPINRKWPIAAVVDAVRRVQLRPHERITFEYVLLGGVNDRADDAAQVMRLLRKTGLPVKVNLITWNSGPGIGYSLPQPEAVETFRQTLVDAGIPAYVRKSRGKDIYAACGQLKRTVEG